MAVEENVQRARGAGAQPDRNSEFLLHFVLEAHGLGFDVRSKEAALDFDFHDECAPMRSGIRSVDYQSFENRTTAVTIPAVSNILPE